MSRSQRHRLSRKHRGSPRNKALLGLLVVVVLVGMAGIAAVGYVVSIAASAPSLSSLKERDPGSNSEVLAADGSRLGFIQASELRLPAEGNEFPKLLKDATVAIEDRRFYQHEGIDYEGIVRAGVQNLVNQKTVQGGSTITMQLARNLYISKERTYERKIREAKVAEEIENEHSKDWILAKYLNTVPYGTVGGQSAIGAKAAARIYFNKRLGQLTLREAALLAGLPQAPSLYSPLRSRGAAKARRNDVLREMARSRMITQETAARTMRRGLGLDPSTYFTRRRESYFFDYVKDELLKQYGAKTVRLGGLEVRTTVDLAKQKAARDAIEQRLGDVGPSSAIVTVNPRNGYIEAMASSASYGKSKFNLAAQGSRQPGSTFKVMALMAALDAGVDPDSTTYVSRSPFTFLDPGSQEQIEINTYDTRAAATSPCARRRRPPTTRSTSSSRSTSAPRRSRRRRGRWASARPSRPCLRDAGRHGRLLLAARDGQRLRDDRLRRHAQPADRHHQGHVPRRALRAPGPLEGPSHAGVRRRRRRQGHRHPRGEHRERHGRQRGDGLPRGRQDRDHGQLHRRLVRRLHAAPGHLGLGRVPREQQGADARPASHRQRGRRHVPRGDLGHVHEGGHRQVLRRLQAARDAVPEPAVLRRVRQRDQALRVLRERRDGLGRGLAPVAPVAPAAPDEEAAEEEEDGGDAEQPDTGGGDEGFDPEKYEAPPQEPPGGGDEGGGTQAPG